MPALPQHDPEAEHDRWIDQRLEDATALIQRLGADGVEWLDRFLADYVFEGEPLDQVLVEARQLSELPPRSERRSFDD